MLGSLLLFSACAAVAGVPGPRDMRGPFPIMSTPYHADGSVDYGVLAREAQWTDDCGCPGVIWCQSNDAIDLLTAEEKCRGFEACAKAVEGRRITLALGANGTNTAAMLELAAEIERVAARHPNAKIAMISRPPDNVRTEAELEAAWDALGGVAKRPVIFQTYCSKETPTPSVEMIVRLAKRHPHAFGYVKEEADGNEANDRMVRENAAKPAMKTVFAGWGGWQWLLQLRHCGCEGLVTERCAYAPILAEMWRRYERGDRGVGLASAFAMYRLLIDQRNMPGGLRGYSLYLLQREGVFTNLVSRQYEKAKVTEGGSFGSGRKWKLETVTLSQRQKDELDRLLKDMTDFVRGPEAQPVPELAIYTASNGNRYAEGLLRGRDGVGLYTFAALPKAGEKRPVVVIRNPYIRNADGTENTRGADAARRAAGAGSCIYVIQHCRGRGASEGDFRPYVDERADGQALLDWIRRQDFYDGRIFLSGGSYLSTVHFAYLNTNPKDVVGAVLNIQTPDWYRISFRNGMFKTGLHGGWYVGNAHRKDLSLLRDERAKFTDFPLVDWSRRYYGKADRGFDECLLHPRDDDPYWNDCAEGSFAGGYAKRALTDSTMPVMLRTGFYDIYTEDVFDQWRGLSPERRANCTLIVDAHDHGGKPQSWMKGTKAEFPGGERAHFGKAEDQFRIWCLDRAKAPDFTGFKLGCVTYYALWENRWHTEPELRDGPRAVALNLGAATNAAEVAWTYDPRRKLPEFPGSGGICFGGMRLQPPPDFRDDVKSFLLPPCAQRLDVRGRMTAAFAVKSDCEDTCFYVRVSVNKGDGRWYLLRDDIKPLTYDDGPYAPGRVRTVRFRFADHAFRLEPGDVLRVDVASAANSFQPHPNVPGNPSLARTPKTARNAILPAASTLTLFCLK